MSQWYYSKQGQQVGPVDDQTMQSLLANGTVQANDLIWCEGMAQWTPAAQVPQFSQTAIPVATFNPAFQPLDYSSIPANPRPTSVTVIAVIGIVLGSLGLLGQLCGIIMLTGFRSNPAFRDGLGALPMPWVFTSSVLAIGLILVLLIASIQALKLAPWARKGLIAYAGSTVFLGVINLIITVVYTSSSANAAQQMVGTVFGFIIGMGWAGCILYFMSRPHVVAAFEDNRKRLG